MGARQQLRTALCWTFIVFAVSQSLFYAHAEAAADVEGELPTAERNLKEAKIPLKTDDEVVQREEQAISSEGFSIAELKQMRERAEKHAFQAEVNQLMNIIINSLYSNKEIFLRELISNASDALDKIRFISLTNPAALGNKPELEIRIKPDRANRQLHITDSGIGMTKEELATNLGTIAKSGTREFFETLKNREGGGDVGLIGKFGVGFYSAFLAADIVTVTSKHYQGDKQYVWESAANSTFTVSEDPRGNTLERGSRVTLHVKDEALEFLEQETLKGLVAKYSEFIDFPIYLWTSREETREVPKVKEAASEDSADAQDEKKVEITEDEEDEDDEDEDDDDTETITETVWEWTRLNDHKPLWTRNKADISEEEYKEFYKAFTRDTKDPLAWVHFTAEGDVNFKSILFAPAEPPMGMWDGRQDNRGVKLYVRRVFITDEFGDSLMPKYLAFIKGVVDSDDLNLNVSREILQQDKLIAQIKSKLVRKAIAMIQELAQDHPEDYSDFYKSYSIHLKLGVIEDGPNKTRLSKLLRFWSSKTGELASFDEYIGRMKENQKDIYYLAGESREALERSPLVERLLSRGLEVLYMTDAIDEYALQALEKYDAKYNLVNVAKEGLKLNLPGDDEEDQKAKKEETAAEFKELADYLKTALSGKIERAIVSDRLTKSPSAIVSGQYGYTANMERILKAQALADPRQQMPFYKPKKILEINPRHPIIVELNRRVKAAKEAGAEDPAAKEIAELMFDTAQLSSGFQLEDPADFADRIQRVMKLSLNLDPEVEAPPVDDDIAEDVKAASVDEAEVKAAEPAKEEL